MSVSAVHSSRASTAEATSGCRSTPARISPRDTSISSASVIVTDWPATATGRSPSCVTMRATLLARPEGRATTASPGLIEPLAIEPENPRKSRFGRLTHCTGKRNGASLSSAPPASTSFEPGQQRLALIPRRAFGQRGDVVAIARRNRQRRNRAEAEVLRHLGIGSRRSRRSAPRRNRPGPSC